MKTIFKYDGPKIKLRFNDPISHDLLITEIEVRLDVHKYQFGAGNNWALTLRTDDEGYIKEWVRAQCLTISASMRIPGKYRRSTFIDVGESRLVMEGVFVTEINNTNEDRVTVTLHADHCMWIKAPAA